MSDSLPVSPPPKLRRPLFRKYFAFVSLLVAGSLGIHGTVETYFGYRENRRALMELQRQKAGVAALQIEAFVQDIVQAMHLTTQSPEIQLEGITPRFQRSLFVLLRNHPAIMEATVIDQNGRPLLRHSRLRPAFSGDRQDHSASPSFSTAVYGETYFSPVYFHLGSEPFLNIAVPITDLEGHRLGVLSTEINLKYIRDVVSGIRVGEAGFAYVVERDGNLIAHPDLALVLQKRNLRALAQVQHFMDAVRAPETTPGPQSVLGGDAGGEEVLSSYTSIPQLGWGVFVEQPLREAFDPLYSFLLRTGIVLLAVLLVAVLTSLTLTQAIVRPIERLKQGVSRIGQGDLAERIDVRTADEIGELASDFNAMASALLASRQELEEHNRTLEQRVAARTRELQALFTVTSTVTRSLDIASLTQAALMTTIEVLHVDAGRLYIFDEKSGMLRLTAHHGMPADVLSTLTSYAPGQGIIGRIFQEGRPMVFADILTDPNYAAMARGRISSQLGFRSAAGLPILVQGRPVGVIYVFGRAVREFTPEDLALLSAIGGQIGIAIENARLYHSLEEYSRTLEERVRERTQELEVASRHKSEFLATMSHELRTPLNAVIGFSDLLATQLDTGLSDRHKRYLKNIRTSGHHLLDLINGILDLSKVESGKMDLHCEEVPLRELIQQVIGGVQPQAEAKGLTISDQVEEGLDRVTLDAGKLKQILYNLLGNAVKFTPDGGQVCVAARIAQGSRERDCLEFSVSDTGIGIKPEDQERVFEPFRQIDSSMARKYTGTGLGLALTRKLVELHGGRIRVESTPGRGTTFTFTLALPSPVLPAVERRKIPPQRPEETEGEREAKTDAHRPLILVVEDDPKAIDLLSSHLGEGGYRVAIARSGREALAKARALRPLAITLDILFPTEDGWQILQDLKTASDTQDIPVLIVSIVDDRPRGLQMGAADYLVKPVTKEALFAGLARLGTPSPRLQGMQVLAIDDDPRVLELLGASLEGEGISIVTATNGPEGIHLAQAKRPDLIILDLMMPGMTGFEVIQHLRANPATAGVPIFICTAKTVTTQERELLAKQVEGIVQKGGFLRKDILQMIAEVGDRLQSPLSSG
jgi:signal transduction histidine kinase/CheY-like chemotaxis protein